MKYNNGPNNRLIIQSNNPYLFIISTDICFIYVKFVNYSLIWNFCTVTKYVVVEMLEAFCTKVLYPEAYNILQ
jgi:hypothetical protein